MEMTVILSSSVTAGTTIVQLQVDMDDNSDPEVVPTTSDINIIVVPCAITAQTIPTFSPV